LKLSQNETNQSESLKAEINDLNAKILREVNLRETAEKALSNSESKLNEKLQEIKTIKEEFEEYKLLEAKSKEDEQQAIQEEFENLNNQITNLQKEIEEKNSDTKNQTKSENNTPSTTENSEFLKSEVTRLTALAEQLEKLGTEAVEQVYGDLEREREEKKEIVSRYEEEKFKREKVEEDLHVAQEKLQQLDGVMQKLLKFKGGRDSLVT